MENMSTRLDYDMDHRVECTHIYNAYLKDYHLWFQYASSPGKLMSDGLIPHHHNQSQEVMDLLCQTISTSEMPKLWFLCIYLALMHNGYTSIFKIAYDALQLQQAVIQHANACGKSTSYAQNLTTGMRFGTTTNTLDPAQADHSCRYLAIIQFEEDTLVHIEHNIRNWCIWLLPRTSPCLQIKIFEDFVVVFCI